jgi:hypothetical protein
MRIGDPIRAERRRRRRLELAEDRQQLEGDQTRAVRRVRRHPDAAVVDSDRLAPCARVGREVTRRDGRAARGERPGLTLADVTLVEGIEAIDGERLERPGKGRQPDPLAWAPRPAQRPEDLEEPGIGAERFGDPRRHPLDRFDEAVPGGEAATGQVDRRPEDRVSG